MTDAPRTRAPRTDPAPAAPMTTTPTPKLADLRLEMARKRAEEKVEADRITRRDLLFTALQCFLWAAAGIFLLGWSVHTTDRTLGAGAFYLGLGVGNAGIIFTLLAAYRRGEKRGDW